MDAQLDVEKQDYSVDGIVNFSVFGVGGAGKVAAINFAQTMNAGKFINRPDIVTIDTSGLTTAIDGVEAHRISDLNGSGKLRKNAVEPITNFIADYSAKHEFNDVNIIIMSFSGGSGSVIGPFLVDEIARQKKIAIVLGIIDMSSEIDTINALNCLRTLNNICSSRQCYLPMILFDNKYGRIKVNNGIGVMMQNLYEFLSIPYIGLDKQDRIKFLNPQVFDTIETGIKLVSITRPTDAELQNNQVAGEWDMTCGLVTTTDNHDRLDGIMIISNQERDLQLTKRCVVTYRGYFLEQEPPLILAIGYQIPAQFIAELNSSIHASRSTVIKKNTIIDSEHDIGEESNRSGFIF